MLAVLMVCFTGNSLFGADESNDDNKGKTYKNNIQLDNIFAPRVILRWRSRVFDHNKDSMACHQGGAEFNHLKKLDLDKEYEKVIRYHFNFLMQGSGIIVYTQTITKPNQMSEKEVVFSSERQSNNLSDQEIEQQCEEFVQCVRTKILVDDAEISAKCFVGGVAAYLVEVHTNNKSGTDGQTQSN